MSNIVQLKSIETALSGITDTPDTPDPIVAPTPDDLTRRAASERAMQRKYAGEGRAGTILSSNDSKLG